jgi:uncharacterized coiled-coil DUF342 family protein
MLEMRQQTVPMKIPEERVLLEKLKHRVEDLDRLKKIFAEQDKILKEVRSVDSSIDELFRRADKEHAEVVRLNTESRKHHEEAVAISKDIAALSASADKKHQEFMKLRTEADEAHKKASDMRDKVLEIRKEKRVERTEERNAIRQVNVAARKALDDKDKKDKAVEQALQALLKGGKIEIK